MNQRDIGVFLGMGIGSAVCRQLRRLRERQAHDIILRERMDLIAAALDATAGQSCPTTVADNKS